MFINSRKIITSAARNFNFGFKTNHVAETPMLKRVHTSSFLQNIPYTAALPIPNNIDPSETTRFSPQRARDINGNIIQTQSIDITADNSYNAGSSGVGNVSASDPHIASYDCFGAVSLNSVMQSNVPTPFVGVGFSHLNMPGGQWSQEGKFTSQSLHSSHYRSLRENTRSGWMDYNQNAFIQTKEYLTNLGTAWHGQIKRHYSAKPELKKDLKTTEQPKTVEEEKKPPQVLSKKEQLKKTFKEYGATVVVFHIGISLISLGGFYVVISSGINMMPILDYLGLSSSALATKITTGASTFVVAYAIHKVFAPVRISITLGATPFIVRYLRSKGLLKAKT